MKYKVSVVILNWSCLEVAKDSVRVLLKEPWEVIVVDSGSNDGSKEYFKSIKNPNFKLVDLPENEGISKGRNKGIDASSGKDIFLLDSDILYVKGTIAEYQKILAKNKDAFCIGQNSMELLKRLGHNGTDNPIDADFSMGTDYEVVEGFPMAWTNFGLFRGDLLRKVKFYEEGVYGKSGYGLEDTWLWHEMKNLGYVSLACSLPIFYHLAHNSFRQLNKTNAPDNMKQRKKIFEKKWGKKQDWSDLLLQGVDMKTRLAK